MHGVGFGSLHSAHSWRSREASQPAVAAAGAQERRGDCRSASSGVNTERQAVYQSVVLVLREKFSVSGQAPVPVAGLTPAEQSDNQLATTLGAALNVSPDVPAEDVGAAAEAGLQQALSSLAGSSGDPAALADIAADIRDRVQSLVAAFVAAREGAPTASATSAKVTTKERGVLEIHTLEGDVVKIDFRNSTSVRLGSSESPDGMQSSLKVRISEHTSLQVEGDLNPAELAAIGDLVRKVDSLANEFFAGDVEQAFAAAADLQIDGSQLADYSLRLSMSQKVRIRTTELTPAVESPQLPAPAATAPPSSSGAVPETGGTAAPAVESPSAVDGAPVAAAADAAMPPEAPRKDEEAVANVQAIIGAFVAKLRASFTVSSTDASLGFSRNIKLSLLTAAIEAHAQSTAATPEATASLKQVVDQSETRV